MRFLSLVVCAGCTIGGDQDFELRPGPAVSDNGNDVLFELVSGARNTSERLNAYRVVLREDRISGGLFGRNARGDGELELAIDNTTPDMVEPGDVIRVHELTTFNAADNGRMLWINLMVDANPSSEALTHSWDTVWAAPWRIGG